MIAPAPPDRLQRGFTLVEMLVSIAILTLLFVGLTQVLKHSAGAIHVNNGSMDSLRAGESIFSTLAMDVSRMLIRKDVEYAFDKKTGDDQLAFYTRNFGLGTSNSPGLARPLSVVSYQMRTHSGRTQLEYAAQQVDWAAGAGQTAFAVAPLEQGARAPKLSGGTTLPIPTEDTDYSLLGEEIIRFEICFLVKPSSGGATKLTTTLPATIQEVSAIVVGMVVVDPRSRLLIQGPALLASKFPDAQDGEDLLSIWAPIRNDPDLLQAGSAPPAAQGGIRLMQRYFTISP